MSRSRTILVEDVGPAGNLVVPVQPGGTILTGYCGSGKSITLEAIALGLGSKDRGRVAPRRSDDVQRGRVECLGVVLNVSAGRVTRSGESDVVSREEFTLGDLIDPPVKDDAARNRYGIKSLLRLSNVAADPVLFHHLAGDKEQFEKLVDPDSLKTDDLVEMAGRIKRAMESRARAVASQAEKEEQAAAGDRNAGEGLDLKAESDAQKLQQAHTTAVQRHAALETQWDAYWDAQEAAEDARKKLAEVSGDAAQSMQAAQQALETAKENRDVAYTAAQDAKAEVAKIRAELKAAEAAHGSALVALSAADDAVTVAANGVKAVENNTAAYAGWQAAIDAAAGGAEPDGEALDDAKEAVQRAQTAIETGALVRSAKERLARAKAHQELAAELRREAERLREAAQDTDSVLSAAVASSRFAVRRDVLLGTLPDGSQKPFYDLSDGERTLIATSEKIDRVRAVEPDGAKLAIIDLCQRTFQDLPPSVREALFSEAASKNVAIVTAQVTDDRELKAVVWQPGMFAAVEPASESADNDLHFGTTPGGLLGVSNVEREAAPKAAKKRGKR